MNDLFGTETGYCLEILIPTEIPSGLIMEVKYSRETVNNRVYESFFDKELFRRR
jgi:hypothetical protein